MSDNTFIIGEDKYTVFFFLGRQALTMAYRVSKYFSSALAEIGEIMLAGAQGGEKKDIDLRRCFTAFYESCSEDEFLEYADAIFEKIEINGKPGKHNWQAHFQGKPKAMLEAIYQATRIQFSDFFSDLFSPEKVEAAKAKLRKATLED